MVSSQSGLMVLWRRQHEIRAWRFQLICYRSCNLSAALYPLQRLWPYTMGVAILRECGKHKAKMYVNVYCVVLSRLPLPNVPCYPRTTRG
jgi:hypothetical protein